MIKIAKQENNPSILAINKNKSPLIDSKIWLIIASD